MKIHHEKYHLFGAKGCGSILAELFMAEAGLPYSITEVEWAKRKQWKAIFGRYNPLAQVPTLVINKKHVLTESLGIAVHCDGHGAKLIPKGKNADDFWRWAVFIVANIYPTFTVRDNIPELVSGKVAQEEMSKKVMAKRKSLWRQMEKQSKGTWFLGQEFSAIDVYIAVMTYWTPGKKWFTKNCPNLTKIANRYQKRERAAAIFSWHTQE